MINFLEGKNVSTQLSFEVEYLTGMLTSKDILYQYRTNQFSKTNVSVIYELKSKFLNYSNYSESVRHFQRDSPIQKHCFLEQKTSVG